PVAASLATPTKLGRDQEKFLLGLFSTTAAEMFQEGRKQELTFADACRFWGITENQHGEALDARLTRLRASLGEIDRVIGTGNATLSNGRSVSTDDLGQLCDVHAYLEERFARHLTLLRNRVA